MSEKLVRVIRCIEYIGPESLMKSQIENSIHGVKRLGNGMIIAASTVGVFPDASILGEESLTKFNTVGELE